MKRKHTKYTQINTNESMHSEMGPVWQNSIQRTARTAHLSVLMTVHSFSTWYNTEQFRLLPPDKHHSSDVVYWRRGGLTLRLEYLVCGLNISGVTRNSGAMDKYPSWALPPLFALFFPSLSLTPFPFPSLPTPLHPFLRFLFSRPYYFQPFPSTFLPLLHLIMARHRTV